MHNVYIYIYIYIYIMRPSVFTMKSVITNKLMKIKLDKLKKTIFIIIS